MILWPILAIVLSVSVVILSLLLLYVDDWQRDLRTNHASTSDDPQSPLAAVRSDLPVAELANHCIAAVARLPRWRLNRLDEGGGEVTIRFRRATPLLRFKDDVVVRIAPEGEGSILRAESKSRLGSADFGQNPRNLRELLAALKEPKRGVMS